MSTAVAVDTKVEAGNSGRRALATCCGAHVLHDGFVDLLYVLLPVWQAELGLSLAQVGFLRTLYSGAMAGLQMPASFLAERFGERALLTLGTAVAGCAYLLAGWSGGFAALALCLALGGAGASVQHPVGSSLTARFFVGRRLRAALSTYNFSGDVGKMALPAAAAWLVATIDWRATTELLGLLGLIAAAAIYGALGTGRRAAPPRAATEREPTMALPRDVARRGFAALSAIGIVDSATRTGFLTFLPFLLGAKGASVPTIGLALSLVFAGGATGKFVVGIAAARIGILRAVVLTELATAAGILALLPLPLEASLALLPLIGIALNGTSSVLYGTVAELAPAERRARAFGLFYTLTIGAGALSPWLYGLFSDEVGVPTALTAVAAMVLLTLPLTLALRPAIRCLEGEAATS